LHGKSRRTASNSRSRSLSMQRRPRHSDIAERYAYSTDSIDRTPLHRLSSRSSFSSNAPAGLLSSMNEADPPVIGRATALTLLIISSLLVAVCADFLVGTIEAITTPPSGAPPILSESLIGLIILPIAGNAAEHITAVTVALKGKLDLAIGVALGSSIQIALFVSPLMVIVGWGLGKHEMTMYFGVYETVVLVGSGMLVNFVIWNGRTNWLEGVLLGGCYFMVGVGAVLLP
jgi:Ca2+:H+ antiporter